MVDEIVGTPSYIFISGGRNDFGLPVADIAAAADALFGEIGDRYPGAEIFVVCLRFDDDSPPSSPLNSKLRSKRRRARTRLSISTPASRCWAGQTSCPRTASTRTRRAIGLSQRQSVLR